MILSLNGGKIDMNITSKEIIWTESFYAKQYWTPVQKQRVEMNESSQSSLVFVSIHMVYNKGKGATISLSSKYILPK